MYVCIYVGDIYVCMYVCYLICICMFSSFHLFVGVT